MPNTVFMVVNNMVAPQKEKIGEYEQRSATRAIFTTSAPGTWRLNCDKIIGKCFRKRYPDLVKQFQDFKLLLHGGQIMCDFIVTGVTYQGTKRSLAPRCYHVFLNSRPVRASKKLR
jgi:hypothetical protein